MNRKVNSEPHIREGGSLYANFVVLRYSCNIVVMWLFKVDDTIKIAEALLSDLSGFRSFHRSAEDLLDQFKLYEQEQFDDWSRDIQSGLSDSRSGLW